MAQWGSSYCYRCGAAGHFARECYARTTARECHTKTESSPFGTPTPAPTSPAPKLVTAALGNLLPAGPKAPPGLQAAAKWTAPGPSEEDEERNEAELRSLLAFLNQRCAILVKILLGMFGAARCNGELFSNEELMRVPIRGKMKELVEVIFQKGHRVEAIFAEADGSLTRVDVLDPLGTASALDVRKTYRCGDAEMELFMDQQFPKEWWRSKGRRFGIKGTLHRVSGVAGRTHNLIGVIVRIGRSIGGVVSRMLPPSLAFSGQSILIVGPPNSGKTTVLRDLAKSLSEERGRIVVVVDKTCEIAGASDEPHASIGSARWQPVDSPENQHEHMRLAVENMSPSTVIVDEISTWQESEAAKTISQRGVQLIATVHGRSIAELIDDKERSGLLGGVTSVTLAKTEVGRDGRKQVPMRKYPPLFGLVLELRSRDEWFVHENVADVVDAYLRRERFKVMRTTPGEAEMVTAVPSEEGFTVQLKNQRSSGSGKVPFDFGEGPVMLAATMNS